MKQCRVPPSSVILSGAKDPIPAYTTTALARSFYHSPPLTSRVPPAAPFADLEGVTQ